MVKEDNKANIRDTTPSGDDAISSSNTNNEDWATITTEMFETQISRYLDESKPDPMAQRQIKQLQVEWTQQQHQDTTTTDSSLTVDLTNDSDLEFIPRTVLEEGLTLQQQQPSCGVDGINGMLKIEGEYIVLHVEIKCHCYSNKEKVTPSKEKINLTVFEMYVKANFLTTSQVKRRNDAKSDNNDDEVSRTTRTSSKTIRTSMIARLRNDDYIQKLIMPDDDDSSSKQVLLCKAILYSNNGMMEERTRIDQDLLMGVQRAIVSQLPDTLSTLEFLLAIIPNLKNNNRIKLRLLEHAMVDACENQQEEFMLEELEIKNQHKQTKKAKNK